MPRDGRERFLVGYGLTLRNVGRVSEAVALLREAARERPDYPALRVFLALALNSNGAHGEALATMIDVVLTGDGAAALDGYDRALRYYRDELVAAGREPR